MNQMNQQRQERDYGFGMGLMAGTVVGVGLLLWLAPRAAAELRQRVSTSAKRLRDEASDQYDRASDRVEKAVGEVTRKAESLQNTAADSVAHGAREVERVAVAAKTYRSYTARPIAARPMAAASVSGARRLRGGSR